MSSFWRKQQPDEPLFPDIEWNKPEQKSRAGKLLIIGGNSLGFVSVAQAYSDALELGVGQVRVILPDALKKAVPPTMLDVVFVASNPSGGISKQGQTEVTAGLNWADHVLLIGDAGRNSESAALYESIIASDVALTITRDAVDLVKNAAAELVQREKTTLVVSFAQLQKLFQLVYYPKIISFSTQLNLFVDILHKFTISYPVTVVTYHHSQLVIAHDGQVITQAFEEPMMIWRGTIATKAASYQLWTPSKPLESITSSIL